MKIKTEEGDTIILSPYHHSVSLTVEEGLVGGSWAEGLLTPAEARKVAQALLDYAEEQDGLYGPGRFGGAL